jgi:hypothetical protein
LATTPITIGWCKYWDEGGGRLRPNALDGRFLVVEGSSPHGRYQFRRSGGKIALVIAVDPVVALKAGVTLPDHFDATRKRVLIEETRRIGDEFGHALAVRLGFGRCLSFLSPNEQETTRAWYTPVPRE